MKELAGSSIIGGVHLEKGKMMQDCWLIYFNDRFGALSDLRIVRPSSGSIKALRKAACA
ncbi:hypothetical protein [Sphingobium sp.]|uniref:hypothetical protein n=1 Tax=Sphingobium sp. TaxID=1912891 RepID=UPI0035C67496